MSSTMKLKTLEAYLQDLQGFHNPKVTLEQYETPPHIAALALYTIQTQYQDLEGKLVLDAGCGTGVLSIGAALMGAALVTAVDVDPSAIEAFKTNIETTDLSNIDALLCDFLTMKMFERNKCYETVIMNPPFGTKHNAGIDLKFLNMGLMLTSDVVYSLHKSSTRSFIQRKVKEWGGKGNVIAELRYDLPASYKFHKQQSRDIAVDLWQVNHPA